MPTQLYEKPPFPRHIRDRIKRYDKRLDLLWNAKKGRWELWQGIFGRQKIIIRTNGHSENTEVRPGGFEIDRSIKTLHFEPPPKPFRVMVLGDILIENEIMGRLWFMDVWRFKNPDVLADDIAYTNTKQKIKEIKEEADEWEYRAKQHWRYFTNTPWMGYGGGRSVNA